VPDSRRSSIPETTSQQTVEILTGQEEEGRKENEAEIHTSSLNSG